MSSSDCCGSAKTVIQSPRNAAQGFADHLNSVLNRTVTDSRLSLIPLPRDADAFMLTRLVDRTAAPLELHGSSLRLFIRHVIVVVDGHCQTSLTATAFRQTIPSSLG